MRKIKPYFLLVFIFSTRTLNSQTTYYKQFSNEFDLIKPLSQRFAGEVDLGNAFSDSPEKSSMFANYTQFFTSLSLHYYYSAKWNFSFIGAYFANKYVPEIGQREYPEIRLSGQGNYFFKKIGYILQSRTRIEYRLIQNSTNGIDDVVRLRERIRFTKPIHRKIIRAKTYYAIISDEVFIKSPSNITGTQIFDRNIATLGLGYAFTNNLLVDLLYTFQYVPRTAGDEIYNGIQLNFTITNPFLKVREKFKKKETSD